MKRDVSTLRQNVYLATRDGSHGTAHSYSYAERFYVAWGALAGECEPLNRVQGPNPAG